MTSPKPPALLPLDPTQVGDFGPATIEHRTAQAGFSELGTYLLHFQRAGQADPWTVQYEESAFVIDGEATFVVGEGDEITEIVAAAGEIVALPKGTTVRYGGSAGTRVLLSIAPVNWRSL